MTKKIVDMIDQRMAAMRDPLGDPKEQAVWRELRLLRRRIVAALQRSSAKARGKPGPTAGS